MRDLGLVGDLSDVVRLGAAVMVRRCCEEYRRRRVGTGWLIEAIRQGGAWCDPDRPPSPSQLLREIWGGPEPPWEWPQ